MQAKLYHFICYNKFSEPIVHMCEPVCGVADIVPLFFQSPPALCLFLTILIKLVLSGANHNNLNLT
jgi:hypothetical protein